MIGWHKDDKMTLSSPPDWCLSPPAPRCGGLWPCRCRSPRPPSSQTWWSVRPALWRSGLLARWEQYYHNAQALFRVQARHQVNQHISITAMQSQSYRFILLRCFLDARIRWHWLHKVTKFLPKLGISLIIFTDLSLCPSTLKITKNMLKHCCCCYY